jgi:hypothetical protein
MLPVHAPLARRATESHAKSALPGAPVVPPDEGASVAATRRALANRLIALADRVSPEPVERSRWQSG